MASVSTAVKGTTTVHHVTTANGSAPSTSATASTAAPTRASVPRIDVHAAQASNAVAVPNPRRRRNDRRGLVGLDDRSWSSGAGASGGAVGAGAGVEPASGSIRVAHMGASFTCSPQPASRHERGTVQGPTTRSMGATATTVGRHE
jgi:hypothetical protein